MFLNFKVLFRLHALIITSHELTKIPNDKLISIQSTISFSTSLVSAFLPWWRVLLIDLSEILITQATVFSISNRFCFNSIFISCHVDWILVCIIYNFNFFSNCLMNPDILIPSCDICISWIWIIIALVLYFNN